MTSVTASAPATAASAPTAVSAVGTSSLAAISRSWLGRRSGERVVLYVTVADLDSLATLNVNSEFLGSRLCLSRERGASRACRRIDRRDLLRGLREVGGGVGEYVVLDGLGGAITRGGGVEDGEMVAC